MAHFDAEHFHAEHFRVGPRVLAVTILHESGPRGHDRRNDRDWWELYGRPRAIRQPREKFDHWASPLMTPEEERRAAEQARRTNGIEAMLAELERQAGKGR